MAAPLFYPVNLHFSQSNKDTMTIQDTLKQRQNTHGDFATHAVISQALKKVMHDIPAWETVLSDDQREALDMIQHKVARILNGNPNYDDHWQDICGYSQLVLNTLEGPKI